MPEINNHGSDGYVSPGEVLDSLIGAKPADEDGGFTETDRESAATRLTRLFNGSDLEDIVQADGSDNDGISRI